MTPPLKPPRRANGDRQAITDCNRFPRIGSERLPIRQVETQGITLALVENRGDDAGNALRIPHHILRPHENIRLRQSPAALHRCPKFCPIKVARSPFRHRQGQDRPLPHQRADQPAFGPRIKRRRWRDLQQLALRHHGDIGCQRHGLRLIVGDIDHRRAGTDVELAKRLLHLLPEMPVEIGERLVEQHHIRLGNEAAGKRHTLPLATGQFSGTAIGEALEADGGQRLAHLLAIFLTRNTAHLQGITGIVGNRHMRPQRIGLEHHRHVAPLRRHHAAGIGQHPLAEQDGTVGRLFETGDHAQHRRFAAAGGPEQSEKTAVTHGERHIVHGWFRTGTETLRQAVEDQFRQGTTPFGR
ncbi:phenol hydroxylase [Agrobacterium tumefaciens str. Cherry 2E-2-2]|nr:phenol hydroxylase [Agrobacterium tumefaciens str. Cherry 2E-2-2]